MKPDSHLRGHIWRPLVLPAISVKMMSDGLSAISVKDVLIVMTMYTKDSFLLNIIANKTAGIATSLITGLKVLLIIV